MVICSREPLSLVYDILLYTCQQKGVENYIIILSSFDWFAICRVILAMISIIAMISMPGI